MMKTTLFTIVFSSIYAASIITSLIWLLENHPDWLPISIAVILAVVGYFIATEKQARKNQQMREAKQGFTEDEMGMGYFAPNQDVKKSYEDEMAVYDDSRLIDLKFKFV